MKLRTANRNATPQIIPFTQKDEKSLFWRLFPFIIFSSIVVIIAFLIYWYCFLPRAVGQIYTEKHEISSNRNAFIYNLLVRQGDRVRKGDIIVKLDTEELDAELKKSKMELEAARLNVQANRARLQLQQDDLRLRLDDNHLLRSIELFTAQSALNQARSIIGSTKADLSRATIDINRYSKLAHSGAVAQSHLDDARLRCNSDMEIIKNYEQVIESNILRLKQAENRYVEYAKKKETINVPIEQMMPPIVAEVKIAEAQTDIIDALLDYSALKSPVDGIVSDIYKYENSGIQPGDAILSIDKTDPDTVEAYIKEKWVSSLALNKKIRLVPRIGNHESVIGTINYISPVVTIIPAIYMETYNQQFKEKGIRFTIVLDKQWAGPAGATFDMIP